MDFLWSEETFSIPRLVENVEFPQILKLVNVNLPSIQNSRDKVVNETTKQRYSSVDNNSSLQDGNILKLHGIRTFKRVIITGAGSPCSQTFCEQVATEYGYLSPPGSTSIYKQFSVPANYSLPLQILPFRDLGHVYATAGDLVKEHPRPSAVVVNKTIYIPEKHIVIKEGDVLAITSVDKRCTSNGVVDFLICKYNDKAIGLPMSCVGDFTALQDETLFTLSDLVAKHIDIGFPQKIRFQAEVVSDNNNDCPTLTRGGEHHVVPGEEYIAENIIKQQYLVCTRCVENVNGLSNAQVFYIPTNCSLIKEMKVRLPMITDQHFREQVLNNRFCPNLSMREILDASPIELVGQSTITVKKLSEVFYETPQLPPRKELYPSDSVSLASAQSSKGLRQREGTYANVKVLHGRMNVSESNISRLGNGTESRIRMQSPKSAEQMYSAEEQPLLGAGESPQLARQHKRGQSKTPVLQRKGMSTPCTPENRRKKGESPTWTEKISISLENLKRNFRKTGSEERERRLGDGSQLADSFENLSVTNPDNSPDSTMHSDHPMTYVNMNLVAGQLDPTSRTKSTQKLQPASKCTQIRELWTPPCSPDYRDHTTPVDTFSYNQPQFNCSNKMSLVRPATDLQFVPMDGGNPLQKSSANPVPSITHISSHKSAASNNRRSEQHKRSKSPIAAPRQTKDAVMRHYENLDNFCPPDANPPANEQTVATPSRCSGYSSSGSRGSSENDLLHYQLETIKSVDMIPDDLTTLSVPGLADCLHLFELPNVAHKFKQNQVDGQFFMIMTEHMFRDDAFNFSEFELLKLRRLRDGWRPRL